jgi:hypothetical protein
VGNAISLYNHYLRLIDSDIRFSGWVCDEVFYFGDVDYLDNTRIVEW